MSRNTVFEKLDTFCENRKPATIILDKAHLSARFVGVTEDRVTLDLPNGGLQTFRPLSSAIVVCHQDDGRALMFLGLATDCHNGKEIPRVELTMPVDFIQTECRSTFRVPVCSTSRLQAQIGCNGDVRKARCINLSLTGCLLEVDSDGFLGESDEDFIVKLHIGDERIELLSELRHIKDRRGGFFFPESMRGGEIAPPAALRRIVSLTEREWLRNRNR